MPIDTCPPCGKPMSDGFVGARSWPAGIEWFGGFVGKDFFGIRGEPIGENDGAKMGWMSASRCPDCRLTLAHI
ncbi:MAG: PF20097 family protein [Thermoplasmata archaeon]